MAIAIRGTTPGIAHGAADPTSLTLNGTRQPQAGDLLVIIHANDFYAASNIPTPTVGGSTTGVTAISGGSADEGTNLSHFKSYTFVVSASGDLTVAVDETGTADEDKALIVYVLSGADTANPVDAAATSVTTGANTHICPSVSPSSSDAFLICHTNTGGGAAAASYTHPSGMTETYDLVVSSGGMSIGGAVLQLAASGATGTKTFTPNTGIPNNAELSVAIKTAAAAATADQSAPPWWQAPLPARIGPDGRLYIPLRPMDGGAPAVAGAATLTPIGLDLTPVALTSTPGPVTVTLTPIGLNLTPVALTSTPGPVTVTLTPIGLNLTPVATTPVPQPVTVTMTPATLSLEPVATTSTPGLVTTTLTPAQLELAPVALTSTPGSVTTTLTSAAIDLGPVALTSTPGAVTITLTPAQLDLEGHPLDNTGEATLVQAQIDLTPVALTLPPNIEITPAEISLIPRIVIAEPQPVTIELTPAEVDLEPNEVNGPRQVTLIAAGLDLQPVPMAAFQGGDGSISIPLTSAFMSLEAVVCYPTSVTATSAAVPCDVWPVVWCCPISGSPAVSGWALEAATEVLWALSGRRFGFCTVTSRPCRKECADRFPFVSTWWQWDGPISFPMPVLSGGKWFNAVCGSCGDDCSCGSVSEVILPSPVSAISEVMIDGQVLPSSAYRVDDYRKLVRQDGDSWPTCQNLSVPATGAGAWTVTAQYGEPVPRMGQVAVGKLACELAAACDPEFGGECHLPANLQSLAREGVTLQFTEDVQSRLRTDGRLGIWEIDVFLLSQNPKGLQNRAQVYSPDVSRPRVSS